MEAFYFVFATYEEADAARPQFDSDLSVTLRKQAEDNRRREQESFERSDTDGFVSQWCLSIGADERDREAQLRDNGSLIVRPVLVDIATGQVVAACQHESQARYGYGTEYTWHVFRDNDKGYKYEFVGVAKRESTYTKKGLRKAYVLAPGKMCTRSPGDHTPEPRGMGGLASYTGKHAYIDYQASGLPL